jgi:uncharacterized membrane protein YuzA (DUF378 family)
MRIRLSPWSIVLGLLVLVMIASILGWVPLTPWNVFWIFITVASVWAIMWIFFPKKKS